MFYSKGINNYLSKKYGDISGKSNLLDIFFNHISSYSQNLNVFLDENEPSDDESKKYYNLLQNFSYDLPNITIIVLCKNEERCLKRCLKSISTQISHNDEVIVIDTGSTDESLNIIARFSFVNLICETWDNNFSRIRNLGIENAKNNWIFFIDADEQLENESLLNLKQALNIVDWLNINSIAIAPTIVNHNHLTVQGVRRVLKKTSNIKYYGTVHEELRINPSLLGTDVSYFSLDNVILFHDGYQPSVIAQKNKIELYHNGLVHMITEEPMHPRWLYFFSRDNKSTLSSVEYEQILKKIINLCSYDENFKFYKIRSLSNLVAFYLNQNDLEKASSTLNVLKDTIPYLSDVLYFECLINYIRSKQQTADNLNTLIEYRKTHCKDYGSLHSELYHIDYLIALFFFDIGEYNQSFTTYHKLQEETGIDYLQNYTLLYNLLKSYF